MTAAETDIARIDALVGTWLALPDIATILDIPVTRVHRLIEEGALVDVRRGTPVVRSVPADFLLEHEVVPHLPGTLTLLRDQGLSDVELIEWLFTEDDSLPGTPISHLRRGQRGEVRRRAQSLGF
ncbi:MAG: Rv2175c family DNA-binding protein [Dermabacter sp.]|nr:Rv2175c family DNA-binding protein [Dermabacter sp.]